jgi:hypothetical protein
VCHSKILKHEKENYAQNYFLFSFAVTGISTVGCCAFSASEYIGLSISDHNFYSAIYRVLAAIHIRVECKRKSCSVINGQCSHVNIYMGSFNTRLSMHFMRGYIRFSNVYS